METKFLNVNNTKEVVKAVNGAINGVEKAHKIVARYSPEIKERFGDSINKDLMKMFDKLENELVDLVRALEE